MNQYVVGLLFSQDSRRVVLIKKRASAGWQANMLNGVGGHVEGNETHEAAMLREFREETGVYVPHWEHYASLVSKRYLVSVWRSFSYDMEMCTTTTDEEVGRYCVSDMSDLPVVPNLRYLVPLALNMDFGLVLPVVFRFDDNLD